MGINSAMEIAAAGMEVQQARLEVTIANVAHSRTTRGPDGTLYQPLEVVVGSAVPAPSAMQTGGARDLPRPEVVGVVGLDVPPRRVHDPGHPDADAQGFVTLPAVDPIDSMVDLMEVSRSYEANLRAFDIARSLLQRTLDQWGRS
jgi:flagellar basal-body rod protein FlgC